MQLYNSFTATTEPFSIPTDRPVKLYVCGVTPYDTTHVGHARTYLLFDTLVRYLQWKGAEVHYCQNVTDVDDPLFERAERDQIHWRDLAEREVQRFLEDCKALNIAMPTFFPRASGEIETIIRIVEQLVALGNAYVRDGNVYFRIKSDPDFGTMARMGYDDMLATANQNGNKPDDPRKDDPLDFVLWQRGNPGDPSWESPWGAGRPGWHIECSAMAMRYLGPQIDIHGGGSDLLFPHHSCEIAQTETVTGQRPFSRFWLHIGMVYLDGEKMSKSRGNLVFAHKALEEHDANALRWSLLSVPYAQELHYKREHVVQATAVVNRLSEALAVADSEGSSSLDLSRAGDAFNAAMADNLDTSKALDILSTAGNEVLTAAEAGRDVRSAGSLLADMARVLGLDMGRETA